MIIKRKIGEKGQLVIPKDIRNELDLHVNDDVLIEVSDNKILIEKEKDPEEFLKDFLNVPKIKRTKKTIKEMIIEKYNE